MKISIRFKLIILLFVLIALSIGLISLQSYKVALKDMSSNAKEITRIYAKNISNLIEERLQTVKEKTFFIASNSSSSTIFEKAPEILAVLIFSKNNFKNAELITINPNYQTKYSIDKNFFSSIATDINFDIVVYNQEYLNVSNLPDPISEVIVYSYIDTANSENTIYSAIVIPDVILTAITSSKSNYINYLIDNNGKILAHSDTSQIGKNILNLSLFENFFKDNVINERTMEYLDEKKEPVIGSVFKIKGSNLGVVSKILSKDAYAEAEKLKMILIFSTALVLFISALFSIFFGKTITDPILELSKTTDEIAQGNFLVSVNVTSNDEIGQLARSFLHMGMELHKREETLKETQAALVQSEKMSAFGQIGAGIAHEVKNPLTGILGHAQLANEKLAKIPNSSDIIKNIEIIEKETKRCKNIIENLMRFARQEKEVLKPDDLAITVNEAVSLVDHQLSINGVKIIKNINKISEVLINSNQIEQVLMNLMLNAQHAMQDSGTKELTINTYQENDEGKNSAVIEIIDTGKGISKNVINKIFEPFFTTKPAGQGTGLGLSVSYGIVKDHKGEIYVDSIEGKGTTFTIKIPIPSQEEVLICNIEPITKNDSFKNDSLNLNIPKFDKNKVQGSFRGADPIISKEFKPKNQKAVFNEDVKIHRPERKNNNSVISNDVKPKKKDV